MCCISLFHFMYAVCLLQLWPSCCTLRRTQGHHVPAVCHATLYGQAGHARYFLHGSLIRVGASSAGFYDLRTILVFLDGPALWYLAALPAAFCGMIISESTRKFTEEFMPFRRSKAINASRACNLLPSVMFWYQFPTVALRIFPHQLFWTLCPLDMRSALAVCKRYVRVECAAYRVREC
jgi:hypothetical protein